ncbi:MAG: CoA transferase [Pseudomonadota bacterium]
MPEVESRPSEETDLPLQGLRVIAVEQYGAGPFGTMHLADLGAEVIKVEAPDTGGPLPGDSARHTGPTLPGGNDSLFFQSFNRNKRSIGLNLKGEGQQVLQRLARTADALINNVRGDQPERLGLTYDALSAANPSLVCVHISGYGRTGERRTWPAYDYLMQAEAGYMDLTGEPDAPPTRMGLSVVDYLTGVTAALALVSGVLAAKLKGRGRDLEVSLFDVAMGQLTYPAAWWLNGGLPTLRRPRAGHPSIVPCERYRAADGDLFVMCIVPKFWKTFATIIGRADLLDDARFQTVEGRFTHRDALAHEVDAALKSATVATWMERLAGVVPASPVKTMAEALENPFVTERGGLVDVPHETAGTVRLVASPIRPDGKVLPAHAAPTLGADTDGLLAELGYDAGEIARLRAEGVVS